MTINILYTCDDSYAPYMGISIFSLLKNNENIEEIIIYTVVDGVSQNNLDKLKKMVCSFGQGRKLVIVDAEKYVKMANDMNLLTYRGGHAASLRMFFTDYIQEDVDRLLYLDCDTIVNASLKDLFLMDLDEKAVGVVIDSVTDEYKKSIGFGKDECYFNSGVILFDVKTWKRCEYDKTLHNYFQNPKYKFPNPDQDYLNTMLKENKKVISPKYNFQPFHLAYSIDTYFSCYSKKGYYSKSEIESARENVVIYHMFRFLGQFPWHKNNLHPNNELFWYYANETEWSDCWKDNNRSAMYTIERFLYRCMPKIVFLYTYKFVMKFYWKKKRFDIKKRHH